MSAHPCHRGPDPEDAIIFAARFLPDLRAATQDLGWLLDRGYALPSAVDLVGNRYSLTRRQRLATMRCACSGAAQHQRQARQVHPENLPGKEIWLDGFNVLTAIEVALAGGVILQGRDGCFRDIAGVHSRYRRVEETLPALQLVGDFTAVLGQPQCQWWLDKPVSNSGRLKETILQMAAANHWPWQVELVFSPDKVLSESSQVIATSDSVILDRCQHWLNLARLIIEKYVPHAHLVILG